MRAFADLMETVTAAAATADARSLTTVAKVKTAARITDSNSDALLADLIPRASKLIVDDCLLAIDGAGSVSTFGRETLKATWLVIGGHRDPLQNRRGSEIFLPWRLPVSSIDEVVENGTTLTVSTDYVLAGNKGGRLVRVSSDTPIHWSPGKIVVTFKAGFAAPLANNVDAGLEAACIEQVKAMLFGSNRDPNLKSVSVPDVASESYSVPGGDAMGALALLPNVRTMLKPWRNPEL